MAFCTHCGAPVPDGARFCTSCGTPLAATPAYPQVQPTPAQAQPAQPQPQPQPAQPEPQPTVRATSTPQGIVIDAPDGATVTVSDAPTQESSVEAPSGTGEFVAASWKAPQPQQQPQQQPPRYQQPQYPQQPYQQQPYQQAPQYPQYPQQAQYPPQQPANGPMTVKQALNKSKNDILGQFQKAPAKQQAAPEGKPKRKWYFWLVVAALVIFIIIKLIQIFG